MRQGDDRGTQVPEDASVGYHVLMLMLRLGYSQCLDRMLVLRLGCSQWFGSSVLMRRIIMRPKPLIESAQNDPSIPRALRRRRRPCSYNS